MPVPPPIAEAAETPTASAAEAEPPTAEATVAEMPKDASEQTVAPMEVVLVESQGVKAVVDHDMETRKEDHTVTCLYIP